LVSQDFGAEEHAQRFLGLVSAVLSDGVGKDWRVVFVYPDVCRLRLALWVLARSDQSSRTERWAVDLVVVEVFVGVHNQMVLDESL